MEYIIVTDESIYGNMYEVMFNDIHSVRKCYFVNKYIEENNYFKYYILKNLYRNKINKYLKGKFERVLHPNYMLKKVVDRCHEKVCVIFVNASLQKVYSYDNLKKIKRMKEGIFFVLLFVDPISQIQSRKALELSKTDIFDLVYTYSYEDALKYNMKFIQTPYSKIYSDISVENKCIYFCGSEKGRKNTLIDIAKYLKKEKMMYHFDVFGKKNEKNDYFEIKSTRGIPYNLVLSSTLKNSCILDIVQEEGNVENSGLSLRAIEAFVYGRTLITNNPDIMRFRFYNPKSMHYIKDCNDIKNEWIMEECTNTYNEELSPLHFIFDIEKTLMI